MSISRRTAEVIVVGSGPAAYSAALYLEKHSPLVLMGHSPDYAQLSGGQLMTTTDVDNYPGHPAGIQGPALVKLFQSHAEQVQRVAQEAAWVETIAQEAGGFVLQTSAGPYYCRAVVIATGSVANRLYVKGTHDQELWQRGISACATCDGWLFAGQTVVVIGGGDTAMEEALYLAGIAAQVILVHRSDRFRARPDLLAKVSQLANVTIKTWRVLTEAVGTAETGLQEVVLEHPETHQEERVAATGMFFAIGHTPNSSLAADLKVTRNKTGYIETDKSTMATNVPGVFAAGDVQDYHYRQAITAAYSGMLAGRACSAWLERSSPEPELPPANP